MTTKAEVQAVFKMFLKEINGVQGFKNGEYYLDNSSIYGGIVIYQVVNDCGGVDTPFGSQRQKQSQFVDSLRMAIKALRHVIILKQVSN